MLILNQLLEDLTNGSIHSPYALYSVYLAEFKRFCGYSEGHLSNISESCLFQNLTKTKQRTEIFKQFMVTSC